MMQKLYRKQTSNLAVIIKIIKIEIQTKVITNKISIINVLGEQNHLKLIINL